MESGQENKLTWEDRVCNHVLDEWDMGYQYVSDLNDLYDEIYDMFRGERPVKNFDWQSNIVINKVFQIAWTAVPYVMNKIFGANPIMGVESFDKKGAWQRERLLEYWHTLQAQNPEHIPFYMTTLSVVLRGILNGVSITKKTWHQKLKKEMKSVQADVPVSVDEEGNPVLETQMVKKTRSVPLEDWPHNVVIDNKDVVFDWRIEPGQSIRAGRFVTHRSVDDLGALYESGLYMNLDQIPVDVQPTDSDEDHSEASSKDGLDSPPVNDLYTDVEMYERTGKWLVHREDGEWRACFDKEKYGVYKQKYMIATVAKGGTDKKNTLIRFEPAPYDEINYIDTHIYLDPKRWHSMGMIEPTKDTVTGMNDIFNGILDEMWQNLMPPVIVNKHALWDWDTMMFAPQQRWLIGGDPNANINFVQPSSISRDAWQSYGLLDNEAQQTSVTNAMAGMGKEKTATTNVMNAELSANKLDHIVKMVEQTFLIPSAQMDIRFAKKFAHPLSLSLIVGIAMMEKGNKPEPFQFKDWEEIYKYVPAAASVKPEHQKEREIQEDVQLIQIVGSIPNPQTTKVVNKLLANIFRNRNMPVEADLLDEDYFEPQSEAGSIQQIMKTVSGASNQNDVPMSGQESSVRQKQISGMSYG